MDNYGLEASGIDPEIAAQMLGLKSKRAVAEAILARSMKGLDTPQTPAGGLTPRISPWAALAQVAQAALAQKMTGSLDEQQASLANQNQQKVASAMQQYEQQRVGTPAQPINDSGPGDAADTSTIMNGQAGNPRAAIIGAMSNPLIAKNPIVQS